MFYKSDKNFFGKQIKFKMNKPPYNYNIFTEKGKLRKSFESLKWYIKKYPKLWMGDFKLWRTLWWKKS